jgi:hypothetical protein
MIGGKSIPASLLGFIPHHGFHHGDWRATLKYCRASHQPCLRPMLTCPWSPNITLCANVFALCHKVLPVRPWVLITIRSL